MRAFFFWEARAGGLTMSHKCNPYGPLLARALEKWDITLELGDYAFERDWLETHRKDYDVLHLNWLHWFYRCEDLEATVERYARFAENLTFARSLGYRIVWTVHNLKGHERWREADLAKQAEAAAAQAKIDESKALAEEHTNVSSIFDTSQKQS